MNIDIAQILDTLPDYIRIVDKNLKILWINRKYEDFLRRDRNDITGMSCLDPSATGFKCPEEERFIRAVLDATQEFVPGDCVVPRDDAGWRTGIVVSVREGIACVVTADGDRYQPTRLLKLVYRPKEEENDQ